MSSLPTRTRIFLAIIMVAIALAMFNQLASKPKPKEIVGQIVADSTKAWVKIKTPEMPDIVGFDFNKDQNLGMAVSSEGNIILSTDGGYTWKASEKLPIDGETVTSLSITESGQILVGTMVEDSSYTALYRYQSGKWIADIGNYGGITGISSDGNWAVGGGGLVYQVSNTASSSKLQPNKLPYWGENNTVYSLSVNQSNQESLLLTGDNGLAAESKDKGKNWSLLSSVKTQAPIYSSLLLEKNAYVGGLENFFCFDGTSNTWYRVNEIEARQAIFNIYQDRDTKEVFASGGKIDTSSPLIISSTDNLIWHKELINNDSRIVGLAKGKRGLFAATLLGEILIRQDIDIKF